MKSMSPALMAGLLLAAGTAGACGGDRKPTSSEAGGALKKHVASVLSKIHARNVSIIENGARGEGCSKNKERYLYSVRATKRILGGDEPDLLVDLMTAYAGGIPGYRTTNVLVGKSPATYLHNDQAHTDLKVYSPQKSQIGISGSTDCLK